MAVREWNDQIVFLHKVLSGGTDRSYGIQVARLAGLPDKVIARARELLAVLQQDRAAVPPAVAPGVSGSKQLPLFAAPEDPILTELRELNLDRVTPIEALNLLARWRGRLA
jgi:DNA mismatch repair protein MutS